jgi:uracil-DNA glycosylase
VPLSTRSAADYLPSRRTLTSLRAAAARCRGCDLYRHATQTVFGEGRARAAMMLVGEQPGDSEDRVGHPFVGPAGRVLRDAMECAVIDPGEVYMTNAVKHFKFVERGKRRIHNKPRTIEIRSCKPWLDAEIAVVKPALIVALGATAAQSLLGAKFKLLANRARLIVSSDVPRPVFPTIHPSAILRAPDRESRRRQMREFIHDLEAAAKASWV